MHDIFTELPNALQEKVHLVLWHNGDHLVLSERVGKPNAKWELPHTRVALGESIWEAAERTALLQLDLVIRAARFEERGIFRERFVQGLRLVSVKANLTEAEFQSLREANNIGSHRIAAISRYEIKQFFPRRCDRQLMS